MVKLVKGSCLGELQLSSKKKENTYTPTAPNVAGKRYFIISSSLGIMHFLVMHNHSFVVYKFAQGEKKNLI